MVTAAVASYAGTQQREPSGTQQREPSSLQLRQKEIIMHALEVEDNEPKPGKRRDPLWWVVVRYSFLASLAIGLTLTCPSNDAWVIRDIDWDQVSTAIVAYLVTLIAFWALVGSDPGYLNAETVNDLEDGLSLLGYEESDTDTDNDGEEVMTRQSHLSAGKDPLESDQESQQNDNETFQSTRRKTCVHCKLAPPLRAHHCKVCNQCVSTFDHHCHFVGTCIGERNHCRFWFFLLSQAIGFGTCCSVVNSSRLGFTTVLEGTVSTRVLRVVLAKLYLYPLTAAAITMISIHTFFAVSNTTTFECAKGPRHLEYLRGTEISDCPFSNGVIENIRRFCCKRDNVCYCGNDPKYTPILWHPPGKIDRDSDDCWEHPWRNKYWSCC
jgi:palmitoyltransferase